MYLAGAASKSASTAAQIKRLYIMALLCSLKRATTMPTVMSFSQSTSLASSDASRHVHRDMCTMTNRDLASNRLAYLQPRGTDLAHVKFHVLNNLCTCGNFVKLRI